MYIGNVLIEQVDVDISHEALSSCHEKQQFYESIAYRLSKKHNLKISQAKERPVFFVTGWESKMNNL